MRGMIQNYPELSHSFNNIYRTYVAQKQKQKKTSNCDASITWLLLVNMSCSKIRSYTCNILQMYITLTLT